MILKQNCTTVLNDLITFDDSVINKNIYDDLSAVGNTTIGTTWPSQEFTGTQSYSTLTGYNVTIIDVIKQGNGTFFLKTMKMVLVKVKLGVGLRRKRL